MSRLFIEDWVTGCSDVTRNEAVQARMEEIHHKINTFEASSHGEDTLEYANDICYLLNYIMELENQYDEAEALAYGDEDEDEEAKPQ